MSELWKPVLGYEDTYAVSSEGRVRSLTRSVANPRSRTGASLRPGRILKERELNGYFGVVLYRDAVRTSFRIHLLVLLAFKGPRPDGAIARHLNGNPRDNRRGNLKWGTHEQNRDDARIHGTLYCGERVNTARMTETSVRAMRARHAEGGITYAALGVEFGVSKGQAHAIVTRRFWKYLE